MKHIHTFEEFVNEGYVGPFMFSDNTSDDELKLLHDAAVSGFANWQKGFEYPKADYKKAYTEIEAILKKRGIKESIVDEAIDINDPVLVAMRATKEDRRKKAEAQKERMKKRVYGKQREKLENELWMIAQDLKDAYEDRRNIYDDMEAEAGEKGDAWSDDDANSYGEKLNVIEEEIEKLIKLRQEKEVKLAY